MSTLAESAPSTPERLRILLADDEAAHWLPLLEAPLQEAGIEVLIEADAGRVLKRIEQDRPDALLLDVLFPGGGGDQELLGREILPRVVEAHPGLPIVMFTTTLADDAFQLGTRDFPGAAFVFSKSVFHEERTEAHDPYTDLARCLRKVVADARRCASLDAQLGFVIGRTAAMRDLATTLAKAAPTDLPVLVCGESGTGKELVATSLHALGPRRERSFVKLNCGALSDETLESALFGHEKGAFTGADKMRKGFFEAANGGTLFLDEVQTMTQRLQQSLLRALQDGVIRRMGGETDLRVDVRVIAATNEDLEARSEQGTFRDDLYYRLNRIRLNVPPLRARKDDIGELFAHFVDKANCKLGKSISPQCRRDLLELLNSHDWPGNVRELQSAVETAVALSTANLLTPEDFPQLVHRSFGGKVRNADSGAAPHTGAVESARLTWARLRDIKGETRKTLLMDYLAEQKRALGRLPTSEAIAWDLGTSPDNVRRVLSEAGIKLRHMGS